jgi:outer membrane protein OmpA-like peptidoglycan-associated protein
MKTTPSPVHLLLLTLLPLTAFQLKGTGQVRMAVVGGLHSSKVLETNNIPGWDTAVGKYYSPRTGFQLGVLLEIPFGKKGFYFQPGLQYTSKGRQYYKNNDSVHIAISDTVYRQSTLKLGYIELPLYLTYKMPLSPSEKNHFFLSAGPSFSFFYNGTMNVQTQVSSTNQFSSENNDLLVGNAPGKYKTLDMSLNAKAGFEFGNMILSAYFSRGITNFYAATYPGSFHHQLMGASLGIWLGKPAAAVRPLPVPVDADMDKDGIPDRLDSCPDIPGSKAWNGCPVPDTDHDGIDDEHDSCKTIPGVARYHGCPIPDTDGDGVDDEHDSCRTVPGSAKYNGCPVPDRDGDGVNDEVDKCPDQPGDKENQGCPLPAAPNEKIMLARNSVRFKSGSASLEPDSYQALDELAVMLKQHPGLHLTVNGYTDITGSPALNKKLSLSRAESVKKYLVSKGVEDSRITATGHGHLDPLTENKSAAGKAVNRRVEFKLDGQDLIK